MQIRDGIEIIEKIGEGGMGEVYRGLLKSGEIRTEVAIKMIRPHLADIPRFVEKFQNEIRAQESLSGHPNIVPILESGLTPVGHPYLIMKYIEGQSLRDSPQKSYSDCKKLLTQIESALYFAHSKNVLHGDVSPHNIIHGSDGNFYLIDFGIAKIVTEDFSNKTLTSTSIGKPSYLSPKVLQGEKYSAADDMYSLGITAYELATGDKRIETDQQLEVIELVKSTDLLNLKNISDKTLRKRISKLVRVRQNFIMVPRAFGSRNKVKYIAFVVLLSTSILIVSYSYNRWQQRQTDIQ